MSAPLLLGPDGQPLRQRLRASASYTAASLRHQDLATWMPYGISGAAAISRDRDVVAARVHDIARNDGWASAAMDRLVDNIIGSGWRLSAKPNARTLGIDRAAVDELADQIEAEWQDYATDPAMWCDVERRRNMAGLLGLAFRHRVLDGESLTVLYWKPRGGRYATAIKNIDPDRLSQPLGRVASDTLRDGVEMDPDGAPVAYHIRATHPGDFLVSPGNAFRWERVERETPWGRPIVVHAFEARRSGEVRGISPLSPILKKLKQITRYDEAELQAATINAILAAFVESPFDPEAVAERMGSEDLTPYQNGRLDYWAETPLRMPGAQINFLYPGEKLQLTTPGHPNAVYEAYERAALRNVATALNLSYEQLTMDWSQVNYSSARAALLEIWRGFTARKSSFAASHQTPIYSAWLEEAVETGRIKLPAGAPAFQEARAAYCYCEWIGPGRGWVDPQKEADGAATRMDIGVSTLERECAEQGLDWKEVILQRAREREFMQENGLNPDAAPRPTLSRNTRDPEAESPPSEARRAGAQQLSLPV